jgi:hypothetical protein
VTLPLRPDPNVNPDGARRDWPGGIFTSVPAARIDDPLGLSSVLLNKRAVNPQC